MTQRSAILAHLLSGRAITPLEALHKYGCFRLSSVIFDLRAKGYVIRTERMKIREGTYIARYHLIRRPDCE